MDGVKNRGQAARLVAAQQPESGSLNALRREFAAAYVQLRAKDPPQTGGSSLRLSPQVKAYVSGSVIQHVEVKMSDEERIQQEALMKKAREAFAKLLGPTGDGP